MDIQIHPHALERMAERGATQADVWETVATGTAADAKFGRRSFTQQFPFGGRWNGVVYATKEVEVIAKQEATGWLVVTAIVRYF